MWRIALIALAAATGCGGPKQNVRPNPTEIAEESDQQPNENAPSAIIDSLVSGKNRNDYY